MTEQSDLTADPFAPPDDQFARTGDPDTEMVAFLRGGLFPEELAVILAPLPELAGEVEEHPERAVELARELDDYQLLELFDVAPASLREELNEALAENLYLQAFALEEQAAEAQKAAEAAQAAADRLKAEAAGMLAAAERSGAEADRLKAAAKRL